jgi:phosphate transport system substrate-binding protein
MGPPLTRRAADAYSWRRFGRGGCEEAPAVSEEKSTLKAILDVSDDATKTRRLAFLFLALVLLFSAIWLIADARTKPGGHVSIWGIVQYDKSDVEVHASSIEVSRPSTAAARRLLRFYGSNTVGTELAPSMAAGLLRHQGFSDIEAASTSSATRRLEAGPLQDRVAVEVLSEGSKGATSMLSSGGCDLGMSSRPATADDRKALRALGCPDDLVSCAHTIGYDAVVVIVNRTNVVRALSFDQLKGILTGALSDWGEIDRSVRGKIALYLPDENSGTLSLFRDVVSPGLEITAPNIRDRSKDHIRLANEVSQDPGGLGIVSRALAGNARAVALSPVAQQLPIAPTPTAIRTGDYPLGRPLVLYTAPLPSHPNRYVRQLIDFSYSDEGQAIVRDLGFEPFHLAVSATQPLERVPTAFKFPSGDDKLDAESRKNLDEALAFIKKYRDDRAVVVCGHTDDQGSPTKNQVLAENRAKVVADALHARGVPVSRHAGLGASQPKLPNDNEAGKQANRRAEVWLVADVTAHPSGGDCP